MREYKPSDEDLIGLAKRAFAGLKEAQKARLTKVRSDIARAREEALARLRSGSQR
jgi:uncharacterized protein YbjQ (UPF0145 family)